MSTLSVLTLGFAVAGAAPAFAQNTTAPQPPPTPPAANNPPSPTPGTTAAPPPPPAPTEQQGAAQTNQPSPPSTAMHPTHPTHHMAATHMRRRQQPSPTAQNEAVERLNEMSLQAAQKGQTFTPSGTTPGT